jgi:hypothetical protein
VNWPALLAAGGAAWVAGMAGAACVQFARGAAQAAVAQAGLVATMVHLMLCTVAAAVVTLGKINLGGGGMSFLYWLMACYWMTLIALAAVAIRAVKAAPPGSVGPSPTTTTGKQ